MARTEYAGLRRRTHARTLADDLRDLWLGLARRRAERQALREMARLGPRLIRDAGFDPERVDAAAGTGWDRLDPVGLDMLKPRPARD